MNTMRVGLLADILVNSIMCDNDNDYDKLLLWDRLYDILINSSDYRIDECINIISEYDERKWREYAHKS